MSSSRQLDDSLGWFDANDPYAGATQGGLSTPDQSAPGHGVPGTVSDPLLETAPGPTPPPPAPNVETGTAGTGNSYSQSFNDQRPGLPNLADFKSPQSLQPWTEQFQAPTAQESINSPGFQFRLGEGLKALQRSAAAKGTLLTGGTLKASNDYAQNQATTQYQQDYNNAYNTYDSRRQNFLTNEANRYQSQFANNGQQWNIASDYFNQGSALRQQDFNIFDANRNFDFGVTNSNRNFNQTLNQDYFNNGLQLALLGRPPAPVLG